MPWEDYRCKEKSCGAKWKFLRFEGGKDPAECLICHSQNIEKVEKKKKKLVSTVTDIKGVYMSEGHYSCSKCHELLGFPLDSPFVCGYPLDHFEEVHECKRCGTKIPEKGIYRWRIYRWK
jgi:hypothetical protein